MWLITLGDNYHEAAWTQSSAIATSTVKSAARTAIRLYRPCVKPTGQHFAPGIEGHKKLEDVLHILDESIAQPIG
jgi:hypothetical protein